MGINSGFKGLMYMLEYISNGCDLQGHRRKIILSARDL